MKFDTLVFCSGIAGLKAQDLSAEVRLLIPADTLAEALPPQPAFELSSRLSHAQRTTQQLEIERATDAWIHEVLSRRSCHVFDAFIGTMVVARAGMHSEWLGRLRESHADHVHCDYRDIGSIDGDFRMACFGDYGAEGSVCWEFAGKHDGAVLVYCEFYAYSGDWWRPHTAEAQILRCGVENVCGETALRAIYRVTSARVLANLWRRTSHDDAIARACFPDTTPLDAIWKFGRLGAGAEMRTATFAARHGWVYTQVYGGGSDEHYAVFVAREAGLASRVYAYAATRSRDDEGWWLGGRR
ncbi:hypothetical protein [Tahibacter soli]|uniref:Uncharacterized protein n=1 Tax=Tahibacter soli TaxID=2983605 RepID=A0A9X3YK57_9GAMM|nr:hypothetical protein [Tahibacter soli]MDC8013881.1 hypothetical protein [Tahibacter soli]